MAEEKYCVLKISVKICILNMGAWKIKGLVIVIAASYYIHPLVSTTWKLIGLGKQHLITTTNCTRYIVIITTSLCILSSHWLAGVVSGCLPPASSNINISGAPEPLYFPLTACLAACSCINTSQKNLFPSIMVGVVVTVLWYINTTASRPKKKIHKINKIKTDAAHESLQ